jgi:sugar phosphate isomerase/epimerase
MINRRKFIGASALSAIGSTLISKGRAMSVLYRSLLKENHAVGLQLFTFFNVIDDDVNGTLKKIADIGYKEIESAFSKRGGLYGFKPKDFASLINGLGMSWKSHHVLGAPFKLRPGAKMPTDANGNPIKIPALPNLRDNMQELVDQASEGGIPYLVCANTPTDTLDEIKASIETLNKTDEACHKAGITFCYHNHDMEFHEVEGKIPYDLILTETKLKMELDLAWAVKGGKDPVELFKQNPGRFPLWHVKDLDAERKTILPIGSGTIDYKRIFTASSTAGMQHFFVEHDMPKDAFASIKASYDYITGTLKA